MKNQYSAALLCYLLFTAFATRAQVEPPLNRQAPDKPSLFSALPEKVECNLDQIEALFSTGPSAKTHLKVNITMDLEGVVENKVIRSNRLTSLSIRFKKYPEALLILSRIEDKKGITYIGRIMSPGHADLYLLKNENGQYFFNKQQQRFVMVE